MIKVADIIVYDRTSRIKLVVEVKSKAGASTIWATQMRQNLLTHAVVPNTPYFLLVLPDKSYLWVDSDVQKNGTPPTYTIETESLLSPYLDESKFSLNELSEYSLTLLVISWLQDIINRDSVIMQADPNLKWLYESGLYEAIRGGALIAEAKE